MSRTARLTMFAIPHLENGDESSCGSHASVLLENIVQIMWNFVLGISKIFVIFLRNPCLQAYKSLTRDTRETTVRFRLQQLYDAWVDMTIYVLIYWTRQFIVYFDTPYAHMYCSHKFCICSSGFLLKWVLF